MRLYILAIVAAVLMLPHRAVAQAAGAFDAAKLRESKPIPLKPSARMPNSCAEYGVGFAPVVGTSTCAKIGGSIGVGVGTGNGGMRSTR